MTASPPSTPLEAPVWSRDDAFPAAPPAWGWLDHKGKQHSCESREALVSALSKDLNAEISLIWTPEHPWMQVPEELSSASETMRQIRKRWADDDLADAYYKLKWFGSILLLMSAYALLRGFLHAQAVAANAGSLLDFSDRCRFALRVLLGSFGVGIALLMFIIFAFIPWYQARKRQKELAAWSDDSLAQIVPLVRFETWLERQKAPITKAFFIAISFVASVQIFSQINLTEWSSFGKILGEWSGAKQAGLLKENYKSGELWRLFTAPFLHGNLLHFLMNASALLYLGKRIEVLARWPHLPMVFLFAACCGGEASARFVAVPSVGASGGLMGWLGFLLVFETLHRRLVPRRSTRRLAAGVLLTAIIGLIGYKYIDNAAHIGGLLAGVFYALIVFPASSSAIRPRSTMSDRIAGAAALCVLALAAAYAVFQIA